MSTLPEEFFEVPAKALEKVVNDGIRIEEEIINSKPLRATQTYYRKLGPGLITGAADDDPAGIATYSQTGAQYGFSLAWLALFTLPFMSAVQEMCARIGMVTGRGLAENIRIHYSRKVLFVAVALLFIANTFNIGADLGMMANGIQLIFPNFSFLLLAFVCTVISILLQVFIPYKQYSKYLKWLTFVLFFYIATAFMIHIEWSRALFSLFVPHLSFTRDQIVLVTAILGTTISPYLFFWESSQEVEEDIAKGKATVSERKGSTAIQIKEMRIDVFSGMIVSNMVMFFIIIVCGATLFPNGITNINSAADAAQALRPLAGNLAYFFFAIGIIGTGFLAVPVLAGSSSYAIAETFKWREGLYRNLKEAYPFYGVIIVSMIIGFLINLFHFNPIKMLIYSSVLNGIIAPILIVFIVQLSSNTGVMGKWKNRKFVTWLGWFIIVAMSVVALYTIYTLFF